MWKVWDLLALRFFTWRPSMEMRTERRGSAQGLSMMPGFRYLTSLEESFGRDSDHFDRAVGGRQTQTRRTTRADRQSIVARKERASNLKQVELMRTSLVLPRPHGYDHIWLAYHLDLQS